jgi:UPF0755 protein
MLDIFKNSESARNFFSANRILFFALGLAVFLLLSYLLLFSAPGNFKPGTIVTIEPGMSLRGVSYVLKNEGIIRSRTAFEAFIIIYDGEKHVVSADYLFEGRAPVWQVARRLESGERHLAPVKATVPEGFNILEISELFDVKLSNFNKEAFLAAAIDREGYLFPDTYFFFTTDTEVDVIRSLSDNFEKKISSLRPQILAAQNLTKRTEREIIIMASIIEKEAKGGVDRGHISGILWKRVDLGMPLQVDAALETYKTKGLPKAPISNPGMSALEAAIHPQSSPYLYYLHDKEGNIHYAKDFAEHRQNVLKYLQ